MLRSVLLGSILLLALVPAMPGAAAYDPCDRGAKACPLVYVGDDWACVGARVDYESGGVCAEASPACVTSGWGRGQQTTCVTESASAVDVSSVCVGFKPELDGPMACVTPKGACVSLRVGIVREDACASALVPALP